MEALDGEAEILVEALETPLLSRPNFDAYAALDAERLSATWDAFRQQTAGVGILEPAA